MQCARMDWGTLMVHELCMTPVTQPGFCMVFICPKYLRDVGFAGCA